MDNNTTEVIENSNSETTVLSDVEYGSDIIPVDPEEVIKHKLKDRFDLHALLGSGGMGKVYKAEDLKLERIVAIKVIHPRLFSDTGIAERLRLEAKIVAKLQHPNIVQVYDFIELAGHCMMIMEYIEGYDLKHVVEKEIYNQHDIIKGFAEACYAIHYAHMQGVIHRDIKPSNIMVGNDGVFKIMDFGISVLENNQNYSIEGSPAFMAPETYADEGATNTLSDIYALGITLFFILTKATPYPKLSTHSLIWNKVNRDTPEPNTINSAITRNINAICSKASKKHPSERYDNAQNLADDLRRHLQNLKVCARSYTVFEILKESIRYRPVVSLLSLISVLVFFTAIILSSDHVHTISEKTLLSELRSKVNSIAFNISVAIDKAALIHMVSNEIVDNNELYKLDDQLRSIQINDPEIRDYYLLKSDDNGRQFKIIYARHGNGPLDIKRLNEGHDTWGPKPFVVQQTAIKLMRDAWSGKVIVQEEYDNERRHDGDWENRFLGFAPVLDESSHTRAVLVVEVSSHGIAKAYQQIEDAYSIARVLAVVVSSFLLAGVLIALAYMWMTMKPQPSSTIG